MKKFSENGKIVSNSNLQGDYFTITINAPEIAKHAKSGQFAHIRVPNMEHRILRRPFSIFNTDPEAGTVSFIYKTVGEGSGKLSQTIAGTAVEVMGPLGTFYNIGEDITPIIVAGGYGCAATYMIAKHSKLKGLCLIGGRSESDLLLQDEFAELGYEVAVSTDDGSAGLHGLVTELLAQKLKNLPEGVKPKIYSCGPNPMLKAVGDVAKKYGVPAEISLDEHMCCGVGSCFTCVCKVNADTDDGWRFSRTCKEGPVYNYEDIYWETNNG